MRIEHNASLQQMNTLRLASRAAWLACPETTLELQQLLKDPRFESLSRYVIGAGSNLLLSEQLEGLVIHPLMRGVRVLEQGASDVLIEVQAGENWDQLVQYSLNQGWYGLENLSLIPGTVGAAPFQNIGAYGVELQQRFDSLTAVDVHTAELREFYHQDCCFAYRDSLFKSIEPGRWLITCVRLRLEKTAVLQLGYADLAEHFAALPEARQNAHGVRDLVCDLRRAKLPDPAVIANAGSFFKNPLVDAPTHARLRAQFDKLISYPQADGQFKLAAGWLIQETGWKGKRSGVVGMHAQQALVLVNYGDATLEQVLNVAEQVQASVHEKFGVQLEREPILMP